MKVQPRLGVNYHGDNYVTYSGVVKDEASRTSIIDTLKGVFGAQDVIGVLNATVINFATGKAEVPSYNRALLKEAASVMKQLPPNTVIEIGGHTDSYGDPDYNLQLSRTRAESVRQYLADHGVTNRLTAVGYGASRPLSQDRTRAASKKNRRIEFRVKEER